MRRFSVTLLVFSLLLAGCAGGGKSVPVGARSSLTPKGFTIPAALSLPIPPPPPRKTPAKPSSHGRSSRSQPGQHAAFFAGEAALSNGVYYLALPNGNPFGYYSYLADTSYIYHFDMGYEYVVDANDGAGGVYLYDFASAHWWYTGRQYPFPYVYDFTLSAFLYYFPDTQNAGHYTTGPRYFYNFGTSQIIAMPDPAHKPSLVGVGCGGLCQLPAPYTGTPLGIAKGLSAPSIGGGLVTRSLARDPAGDIIVLHPWDATPSSHGTVNIYSPPFTGSPRPVTNGVGEARAIAVDQSAGTLFVSSAHPYASPTETTTVYAAPYMGAPTATIGARSIIPVIDSSGNLLSINSDSSGYEQLYVFAPPYTSAPTPVDFFKGFANDMVVDATASNLFALNSNFQAFYILPNSSNPVIKKVLIDHGDLANELAIDGQGNLFVAVNGRGIGFIPGTIDIYSPPAYDLSATITTGAFLPQDMVLDSSGNLFVAGYNNAGVRIYAPPYTGTPISVSGISAPLLWLP